ncbi:MAG TPA: anti-sigma factor [Thermoanaerobaculia bacterium]|nr:anti-sigma factor [Thermoanaerobaculia bacterium]
MTSENEREDALILSLVEGGLEALPADISEQEQVLARLYAEVLGLVAQTPEPVAPRPEARERLLAAIAAGEATGPRPAAPAPPLRTPHRPRRWPLALAAGLAALSLGAAGYLAAQLSAAKGDQVRLAGELTRTRETVRELENRVGDLQQRHVEVASRLSLITEPGAAVCALRPQGALAAQPLARGALYVAGDHQHWFLRVSGLPPVPEGKVYHMWFVTDVGPVSGGTFRTEHGASAEIGSPTMPHGMTAVVITIEPATGAQSPSGEEVLFGNQIQLIS